jgi:hypothetical protein
MHRAIEGLGKGGCTDLRAAGSPVDGAGVRRAPRLLRRRPAMDSVAWSREPAARTSGTLKSEARGP